MIGKKLTPFKFWCQKVLPTVYDDSLSYYEYLGKLNEYLNEVIEQINTLTEAEEDFQEDLSAQWTAYKNGLNTEWLEYKTGLTAEWNAYRTQLTQAWTETKNYIDNYFDNLDVQEEIDNKLDEMATDGTLTNLLESIVSDDIPSLVTAWLVANVTPVGSAVVVDTSLTVSGAAADAKVVGDDITKLSTELFQDATIVANTDLSITGKYIGQNGSIVSIASTNFKVTDYIELSNRSNRVLVLGTLVTNANILAVAFYNDKNTFISGVSASGNNIYLSIPSGAKYVRFGSNTTAQSVDRESNIYLRAITTTSESLNVSNNGYNFLIDDRQITPTFINGQFIDPNSGALRLVPTASGFKCTDFVALNNHECLIKNTSKNIVNNPAISLLAFYYDDDYTAFISSVKPEGESVTAEIPSNAKYVIFGSNTLGNGTYREFDGDIIIYSNITRPIYKESNIKIKCDDTYNLILNDGFELFYKGIISSWNDEDYLIKAESSIGANYDKKYSVTPTATGNTTVKLDLYSKDNDIIDTKTITLKVNSVPTSPVSQKNILCVGDSLTTNGEWVSEFKRRLTATGGSPNGYNLNNLTFVGTCTNGSANYEGYGGWTINNYNTASSSSDFKIISCTHDKTEAQDQHSIYKDSNNNTWKIETVYSNSIKIIKVTGNSATFPSTGTLTWVSGGVHHSDIIYTGSQNTAGNPFWNVNTSSVDFEMYAQNLNIASIDYVFVLIGWNDATHALTNIKNQTQTFINNVHSDFPNAKIVFMGLEVPARNGLGVNYGAQAWANYVKLINYVHNLDDIYKELATNNDNVYQVNVSAQFDTEHNMPTGTRAVNLRNSETETYQTNGVHPALSGLYQIADVATRMFAEVE